MHPDIAIPAPANWPRLIPRPTDTPVLRSELVHAVRDLQHGTWLLAVFSSAERSAIVSLSACVVDDFGNLAVLDGGTKEANTQFWHSTLAVDAEATAWWHAQCAAAGHTRRESEAQQRVRDLLTPPPVTAEIVTEPADDYCAASLVIGPDPRTDTPVYSLHVDGEAPVLLTHAQLCALALAANQLVKPAPHGRLQ